jgi:anti-sigma factor ChrR (cupin superfamily)
MTKFTSWLLRGAGEHPSDEQMVAFINGELNLRKHAEVAHHLEGCWKCLAKKKQMEEAVFALVEWRERRLRPHLPPSADAEGRLVALLNEQSSREEQSSRNSLQQRERYEEDRKAIAVDERQ